MIPKVIHYCWFGGNPLPREARKCIQSWRKFCPDYTIKEWNETNFDANCHPYIREALDQRKYAFATDLIRLMVLYREGGVYMDTDVELISPIEDLLTCNGYLGFEAEPYDGLYRVNTGLGMAVISNHPLIEKCIRDYDGKHFVLGNGDLDTTTCPERNTRIFVSHGLRMDNTEQQIEGIRFLPSDFLCPIRYTTNEAQFTENTHSIHHYAMSWMTKKEKQRYQYQYLVNRMKKNTFGRAVIRIKKLIIPKQF